MSNKKEQITSRKPITQSAHRPHQLQEPQQFSGNAPMDPNTYVQYNPSPDMCPATMGGRCYFENGRCQHCNRPQNAQQVPQQMPVTQQFSGNAPMDPNTFLQTNPSPDMCPMTMGGRCHYVNGKCERCERVQNSQQAQSFPQQQVQQAGYAPMDPNTFLQTNPSAKMCPATMGGRCTFKNGVCPRCGRSKAEQEAAVSAQKPNKPNMNKIQQQQQAKPPKKQQQQQQQQGLVNQVQQLGLGNAPMDPVTFCQTNPSKKMCPATMGGRCSFQNGVCKMCQRPAANTKPTNATPPKKQQPPKKPQKKQQKEKEEEEEEEEEDEDDDEDEEDEDEDDEDEDADEDEDDEEEDEDEDYEDDE